MTDTDDAFDDLLAEVAAAPTVTTPGADGHLGTLPEGEELPCAFGDDGRFELLDSIGEGTFGRVYRARDRQRDSEVALKVS